MILWPFLLYMMFEKLLIIPVLAACSCMAAVVETPIPHIDNLPAEQAVLPADMTGQLALLRETMALAEMLQPVAEEPGLYVAPAATARMVVRKWLLPRCRALQQLPSERLAELCLLADAIDWQSAWLLDMAEGDSCVAIPREADPTTCLERLLKTAQALRERLAARGEDALKAELHFFLDALGGTRVLALPSQLLEQRLAKDYKTAYSFFCEFRAALEQGDVAAMQALTDYTDYLLQSEADVLRLEALAEAYATVCRAEYRVRPPAYSLSPAMRAAVQPFLQLLPNMRGILP